MTTSPDRGEAPALSEAVERERREAERARALDELLQRRPDLAGLLPAVDQASESIRWCA
jgi:hypothetical protein